MRAITSDYMHQTMNNTMTFPKSFVTVFLFIFSLFVEPLILSADVFAQNEVLSQEAISAYTMKLNNARKFEDEITNRVNCIESLDKQLSEQRNILEKDLGEKLILKQKYDSELTTNNELFRQINLRFEQEKNEYDNSVIQLKHISWMIEAQNKELNQCRIQLGLLSFVCDLANSLSSLLGQQNSLEGQSVELKRRYEDSGNRMQQIDKELQYIGYNQERAKTDYDNLNKLVLQIEEEIRQLKATLADLRSNLQNNRTLFDEFENALQEANDVDTTDARARTARNVHRISDMVDSTITRSKDISNRLDSSLPERWRLKCSF
jgi:hypothetical protein